MKTKCKNILIALILVMSMLSLAACLPKKEYPQNTRCLVVYHVKEGEGTLIGESAQWVERGQSATTVTVVPALGYQFVEWGDNGDTNPTRTDSNVQGNIHASVVMAGPYEYELRYCAGKGGTLIGDVNQFVLLGGDGAAVSAVPDEGYRFVKWSDGVTDAVRIDKSVQHSLLGNSFEGVRAEFERYERKFSYEYNGATSNNGQTQVAINLDNLSSLKLPVPQRDNCVFEGWYSDVHLTTQVSDGNGEIIADKQWLQNEYINGYDGFDKINRGNKLYAKWRALGDIPTYKLLMIYVTDAHAKLEKRNGEIVEVNYKMTNAERLACDRITEYMEQYLNALLNAKVKVEVDSYFTQIPVVNFNHGSVGLGNVMFDEYSLGVNFEREMPEVLDFINDYQSVLTTFSMNDFTHKLHITGGTAEAKYGSVHFEYLQGVLQQSGEQLYDFAEPSIFYVWELTMQVYVHEFIHTVEMQLRNDDNYYGLHNAMVLKDDKYGHIDSVFDIASDYLLNDFVVNGVECGIPYEFWTGEYFEQ